MRMIERFRAIADDGTIHEIVKWGSQIDTGHLDDNNSSLDGLPEYRTADGQRVTPNADGSFTILHSQLSVYRIP